MTGRGEVVLGVDVGTTAVKVGAFAANGRPGELPSTLREYPMVHPKPDQQVQDPATVLAAVDAAIAECVGLLDGEEIAALSVSTALHGLIGLGADLRPLTPLVTWADSRAIEQARSLRNRGQALELLRRTGTPVHPVSPLVKLIWFAEHEPALAARVQFWVGLKDYVLHHLTGELVTELSSASATGLLDLRRRDWDAFALDLAGVEYGQLSPVLPTTTVLRLRAEVARRVGLPSGSPVAVGGGDGPLGNLGTGAIEPGVAGLSLGTSGAVRMAVGEPSFDPAGRLFCYALTEQLWFSGGAVSTGGNTLRWAGATFAPDLLAQGNADTQLLALAAEVPAGSDGLVMLPYLLGVRAPLYDPDTAGAFLGVRSHHTRSHFLRAAVEGVCLQLALVVEALDSVSRVTSVRATGGPFRSSLWRHVLAATLARPLEIRGDAGGTALGAAVLGWYALGRASTLSEALSTFRGADDLDAGGPVTVSADELAAYARLRAGIPALIRSYDQVAALLAEGVPPD